MGPLSTQRLQCLQPQSFQLSVFWVFTHMVCQSHGASGYQAQERLFRHPEPISGLNLYVHVSTYPCKSYQLLLGFLPVLTVCSSVQGFN